VSTSIDLCGAKWNYYSVSDPIK